MTSAYVESLISHLVAEDVSVSPKMLSEVANLVGYPISYSKVRRAKQKVIESMYGTYEEAYNLVPRMLHQIDEANPGTYINKVEMKMLMEAPTASY